MLLVGCVTSPEKNEVVDDQTKHVYFCDAEIQGVQGWDEGFYGKDSVFFTGGRAFCENCGLNNSAAVILDSTNKFGMGLKLYDLKVGEYFYLSAFEKAPKGKGAMVVKFQGEVNFSMASDSKILKINEEGWVKHTLRFRVLSPVDTAKFFLHSGGHYAVFDDFRIERSSDQPLEKPEFKNDLSIYIPDSVYENHMEVLSEAVKYRIIPEERKGYFEAYIIQESDTHKVEMRLKGDWTDHIQSGFPSYRIKTEDDFAYMGLRSFSIQLPKTRNYLHEWFYHKLLEDKDHLTTTYDFLTLSINGEYLGVFAIEEHFDKQLLESRKRREGPIMKMDEAGFWAVLKKGNEWGNSNKMPYYEASIPDVFKGNRTRKNPTLLGQFQNGAVLLERFKNHDSHPEEIFNLEKTAEYFALLEIGNITHGLAWHNRRFYLNPVTLKLEYIGYDLQPGIKPFTQTRLGSEVYREMDKPIGKEHLLNRPLFQNPRFTKIYLEKLNYFASTHFLDSLFSVNEKLIHEYEDLIGTVIEDYRFDKGFYYEKAEQIRKELIEIDPKINPFLSGTKKMNTVLHRSYPTMIDSFFVKEITLNAYREKLDSAKFKVWVENYYLNDLSVIGFESDDSIIYNDSPVLMKSFNASEKIDRVEFELGFKPDRILFVLKNVPNDTLKKKFIKWAPPKSENARVQLAKTKWYLSKPFTKSENKLIVRKGNYTLDKLVYIPEEYSLEFEPGVILDVINRGGIIANNNVYFNGTDAEPIRIYSSDSTAQGITIIQADSVVVEHLHLFNFNTLNYNGWLLTGAFTVFEANVSISDLWIKGNQCEDGLNLIRCDFDVDGLLLEETFSDAFDADFCTGRLSNSIFRNTGNDCIDFSGSEVMISGISVLNSGDKGVSAGEGSNLTVSNIKINGAKTAFASKDKSFLLVEDATVENVEVGVSAFQKKPEYAPGKMELKNVTYANVERLGLIELNSVCIYKGKTYSGYRKFDIDAMYAEFDKK